MSKRHKPTLTARQCVAVLNAAMKSVETMHGSVTGCEHILPDCKCTCEYGITLRGLIIMRREAYATIQKTKDVKK